MIWFKTLFAIPILLTTYINSDSPDNAGREFVLAFMNNEASTHGFDCFPVDIYISTAKKTSVNVTVSAPRFSEYREHHKFAITYGQLKNVQLHCNIRVFHTSVESKAIYIKASDEVVVYGINRQPDSTDGFLAFPIDVLGTQHFVATYCMKGNKIFKNNIVIAVPFDQTDVEIELANNEDISVKLDGQTYHRKNLIHKTLQRFDVLQIESFGDLTGSRVQSNKPVMVLSGNKKSSVHLNNDTYGIDHLVEQIPPTETWGKRFVTVRVPYRTLDQILRIVAAEDGTLLTIVSCGSRYKYSLDRGQWKQHVMKSSCYAYVSSNKGILVVQFTHSFGTKEVDKQKSDPSMVIISPIGQQAADYVISAPIGNKGLFDNYYLIVMKKSDKNGLFVDGKRPNWLDVHPIDNTDLIGGYIYVGTDTKTHTLRHQSQISIFGAVAYGARNFESYAFPVGMRFAPINKPCHVTTMVVADGLDNDCDGLVDEEICFSDNIDDDGDKRIDEDCAPLNNGITIPQSSTKPTTKSSTLTTSMPSTTKVTTQLTSIYAVNPSGPSSVHSKRYFYTTKKYNRLQKHNKLPFTSALVKRPNWLTMVEFGIIATIILIFSGTALCCCRHFFGALVNRNNSDENNKRMVRYKKKRRHPQIRYPGIEIK